MARKTLLDNTLLLRFSVALLSSIYVAVNFNHINVFSLKKLKCVFWCFFFDLRQLLKHHVVAGSVSSSSLQNNGVMQSLLTTPLRVKFYESEDSEWRPLKVNTEVHHVLWLGFFLLLLLKVHVPLICGLVRSTPPVFIHSHRID